MTTRILIMYSSKEGQTRKIAHFIKDRISSHNLLVDIFDCEQVDRDQSLYIYDGFIIGASVHVGSFSATIKKWVINNLLFLNSKPSSFFSVCLGILEKHKESLLSEGNIVTDFFTATDWTPNVWRIFAGALKYSKYNWIIKKLMRKLVAKAGFKSDPKQDYEFTDWNEVEIFIEQFLDLVISTKNKIAMSPDLERSL